MEQIVAELGETEDWQILCRAGFRSAQTPHNFRGPTFWKVMCCTRLFYVWHHKMQQNTLKSLRNILYEHPQKGITDNRKW